MTETQHLQTILQTLKVSEFAIGELETVSPDTPLEEVLKRMITRKVRAVVAVEDGRITGIFTVRDVIRKDMLSPQGMEAWRHRPIKEFLASPVILVSEDQPVVEAMKLLEKHGIHSLPVVNAQGQLVGVFTHFSLLQFLAEIFPFAPEMAIDDKPYGG